MIQIETLHLPTIASAEDCCAFVSAPDQINTQEMEVLSTMALYGGSINGSDGWWLWV